MEVKNTEFIIKTISLEVSYAGTSSESHGDGHLRLSDCVHGAGDERRLEGDLLGQRADQLDLARQEVDVSGQQDEVVVRQPLTLDDQLRT